ncbi:MAG TPA: NAD(P)H-hydrate dehydratase [Dehalococcoidia bacterium]|nr:NAD(P)H-hydrate dehydratase [Dehalococcoidia bacterium]
MKIVTVEEMRAIERQAAKVGLPSEVLMENAGLAVAQHTKAWLGSVLGRRFLVLAGPGNNGGDGLVVARHLQDWGANVTIFSPSPRAESDANLQLCRHREIDVLESGASLHSLLSLTEVVIDAFFGTGKSRPLDGDFKQSLLKVKEARAKNKHLKVIALDLPSGLDADTGAVDDACVAADLTITLGYPKHGLFLFPGAGILGQLVVADIGIPPELAGRVTTELITKEKVRAVLPQRPLDANKGTFGRVLICGGSINYIGAMYLACEAALRVGAGLVTLATPKSLQPILASKLTEATYAPLPESEPGVVAEDAIEALRPFLANADVLLLGCGLGQSDAALALVKSLARGTTRLPSLVLDADALNLLAKLPQWWQKLPADAILTPHPGEMSRLTGLSVAEVQSRRLSVARDSAMSWQKTIVLKGADTVVAGPDGRASLNPSINPGLASGGTGDVLAGAIAGLVAQGLSLRDAAVAGVFVHSQAGEMARRQMGNAGMLASDLLPRLPVAMRQI